MLEKIKETTDFIKSKAEFEPGFGIILGTGLGGLANEIKAEYVFDYKDIPNFPVSTVKGHKGKLILGHLGGKQVIALQGRFHYYEGYSMQEVTFPIRVLNALGIKFLFLSNANGGLNPDYEIGDMMIVNDHINQFHDNPLRGQNIDELGPRFPDMSEAYNKDLIGLAKQIAREYDITVREGIYLGSSGPTFETPAEYKLFRIMGADAVGMSTVPEVIVARHMGIPCFAISVVTDLGVPGKIVEVTHEDVEIAAAKAEKNMTLIMREMINRIDI